MVNRIGYLLMLLDLRRWWPTMSAPALSLLGACGSQLERMCLLGLVHAMDRRRHRIGYGPQIVDEFDGAWLFDEPWMAFPSQIGPSHLLVYPQAQRDDRRVDFLFWINGVPALVVEVDGYAWHRHRRAQDRERDRAEPLPTLRVREESDEPLTWAASILDADPSAPCTHCGVPLIGWHSCPA